MRHILKFCVLIAGVFVILSSAVAQTPAPPATPVPPRVFVPIAETPDYLVYARAYYTSDAQLESLGDFADLSETEVNTEERYVLIEINASQVPAIEALGFRVEIDASLTEEARLYAQDSMSPTGIPRYACYRTVEETFGTALRIVAQYPALAEWIDIGDSWQKTVGQGGYDLMVLKLTNRATAGPKPKLFIMSGLHAREYAPAEMATRFAEYLVANYNKDPDVTWMLDTQEVQFLLHANPDGRKRAERGLSWRKNTNNAFCRNTNSRGVDLNRNFSFLWNTCRGGSCGSNNPCSIVYRGPRAASEPEVQAIQNYLREIFEDKRAPAFDAPAPSDTPGMMIDLHSWGRLVLWPFANGAKPANQTGFLAIGDRLSYYNGHDPRQGSGLYLHDGVSDDFAYGELGVASFTYELGTTFFQSCSTFESSIYTGNLKSLLYALRVTRAPYVLANGPEVVNVSATPASVQAGATLQLSAEIDDARFKRGFLPAQPIAAVRYSVDVPPWQAGAGAALLPMIANDGTFNATREKVSASIDATGLGTGRHIVYVQGQDNAGNWGPVSAAFFTVEGEFSPAPIPLSSN